MKRERGFSLIEVVISILILAIGIVSLIGAYSNYIKADTYAKIKTIEFNIARAKMEEALAAISPVNKSGTIELNNFKFSYEITVIQRNINGAEMYEIKVRVHKYNDNKEKGVELIAYKGK